MSWVIFKRIVVKRHFGGEFFKTFKSMFVKLAPAHCPTHVREVFKFATFSMPFLEYVYKHCF